MRPAEGFGCSLRLVKSRKQVQPFVEPDSAHEDTAMHRPIESQFAAAVEHHNATDAPAAAAAAPASVAAPAAATTVQSTMPPPISSHDDNAVDLQPGSEPGSPSSPTGRQRVLNIQVGKRPLIVRADCGVTSDVIGQLLPGQLATVVEEVCPTITNLP